MNNKSEDVNRNIIVSSFVEDEGMIPIITDGEDDAFDNTSVPELLPVLPLKNTVLFPGVIIPISVNRQKSLKLINDHYKAGRIIGTISQKNATQNDPSGNDLYQTGTVAYILKVLKMPDESTTVLIQGRKRFMVTDYVSRKPYLVAKHVLLDDVMPKAPNAEFDAVVASLKEMSLTIIRLSPNIPPEASFAIKNIENIGFLINYICSNTDLEVEEKQKLLETTDLMQRGLLLLEYLGREVKKLEIKDDIQAKVKSELDRQQREYYLNQQIKTIQDELGGDPVDHQIEELANRAKKKKWNKQVAKVFEKELSKLDIINPAAPDYSNQLTYLETLLELPWDEYTKDDFDMARAQKVLDNDHFGLEKVKDRILEHLAVLKLKGDLKSPILCLYGPPGVGKTSLGKSIAKALRRKYVRMSLGGLHDEAEIRGHRKTYIGALPGRIIQSIKKAKSSNPVFVLDEIDKIGNDFRGDPAFALLEVLDPEQNNAFYDNYLELEYDLSKVMFIATANTLSSINEALLDRMEVIEVSGYVVEEKIEIAIKHLIPKQLTNHGVNKRQLRFSRPVLERLITEYTRESGVRQLDNVIAKVVRQVAKKIAFGEPYNTTVALADLHTYLGPQEYLNESYQGNEYVGVVTGLAWTAVGGQILYVESSYSKGKGNLSITGNVGNVMKESATLALEYIKAHAQEWSIDPDVFEQINIHIHIPEGAIPKDGPSAGITMVTSLVSSLSKRLVRAHLAMTGEITLRGKVLPVGGIKEKILAAKRASIKEIILSEQNRKDIEVIKPVYIEGLTFHYVDTIEQVLKIAIV